MVESFKGRAEIKIGPVNVRVGTEESEDRPATWQDLSKVREELVNMILDLRRELMPRKPKK